MTTANLTSLAAFLTKVYQNERQRQVNDANQQQQLKLKLQQDLNKAQAAEQRIQAQITNAENQVQTLKDQISDLDSELAIEKQNDGQINKAAKIKMTIGLVILALLTFYLFIFYSSTFYSAFLLSASQLIESDPQNLLGMAVFNTHAISLAAEDGFGALCFILSAPIIFMGLGYILHFFMEQNSKTKWFKASGLLFVTLAFDCILAYKIGELIYNIAALSSWSEMPPFSIEIAMRDINSWAVIFLGFIVYFIWGIVFDMTITAYSELRSNKDAINRLKSRINSAKTALSGQNQIIATLKADLSGKQNEINSLNNRISMGYFIDNQLIKTALADFYAGWSAIMTPLVTDTQHHLKAQQIYDNFLKQMFKDDTKTS